MPMPPVPGGVAIAAMVSCNGVADDIADWTWRGHDNDSDEHIMLACELLAPSLDPPGNYPLLGNR